MKNFKILTLILAFILGVTMLAGCPASVPGPVVPPGPPDPPDVPAQLAVPTGLAADADAKSLTWNNVPNASGYRVDINGNVFVAALNRYPLSYLTEPEIYVLRVKAVGDAESYTDSDWSQAVLYTVEEEEDPPPTDEYPPLDPIEGLTVTFRDEFSGDTLDLNKWEYMLGTGGGNNYWGNNEKQYYTEGDNVTVSDGTMKITAKREETVYQRSRLADEDRVDGETIWWEENADGEPVQMERMHFTSTRIRTAGRFYQKYGRFEAKIKLPAVQAMWPAFWMMPEHNVYGGWPCSGEIDIMEARGRVPEKAGHALHFGYGPLRKDESNHRYFAYPDDYTFQNEGRIDEFHIYRVDWYEDRFEWYIDDVLTYVIAGDAKTRAEYTSRPDYAYLVENGLRIDANRWTLDNYASAYHDPPGSAYAPFDQEFHMLLNLAVGGKFDGNRMPPGDFESADMEVDYVRVWQFDKYLE